MRGDTYPRKTGTGTEWLARGNCEEWRADGLGIDDIAVKTGRARAYVKGKLVEWGLWT